MKIAILEAGHFQYALTQSALFPECEQIIITIPQMYQDMITYHPSISKYKFEVIESIKNNEEKIVKIIKDNKIDLFLLSPVLQHYASVNKIVKQVKCKKVLTTHNINTWFNGRFWSINSLKDRINMRSIIRHSDYIAVEDFIYNHLKSSNHIYFKKHKFIYIPFTLFHNEKERKYTKTDERLKIVLTGGIDGDRRRYEGVLELIEHFKNKHDKICFSFAGQAVGDYGLMIQNKLRKIKEEIPGYVDFFENDSTAEMFRREMETSDIVLSTSTETYNGMGTLEYIGKTKPTAAIHDMLSYQLPGLLPKHLKVPENLIGSVFNYENTSQLIEITKKLITDKEQLINWKIMAKKNSLNFLPETIRKDLPF